MGSRGGGGGGCSSRVRNCALIIKSSAAIALAQVIKKRLAALALPLVSLNLAQLALITALVLVTRSFKQN